MNFLKKTVIFLFFGLVLTSCANFEKTTLEIIAPADNSRLVNDLPANEGDMVPIDLIAVANSNRKDVSSIPARVFINDTFQGVCNLNLNIRTTCQIPLINDGVQKLRLEVDTQDGKVVVAESEFVWVPNRGFDKVALMLAQKINSNDVSWGYIMIGFACVLIFTVIGLASSRQNSYATTIILVWALLIGMIVIIIKVDPVTAYLMFSKIIGSIVTISFLALVAFIASKGYSHQGADSLEMTFSNRFTGTEIAAKAKRGSYTGPAHSAPARPQLNGQSFADAVKASFPPMEAYRQIRSQPDWQKHLPDPDLPFVDADFESEDSMELALARSEQGFPPGYQFSNPVKKTSFLGKILKKFI